MNTSHSILILTLLISNTVIIPAQTCKVTIPNLSGTYTGACKNGKADGQGLAIGIDTFNGNFKKGYPDGAGKYCWKNGDSYEGMWAAGEMDGLGALSKRDAEKRDGSMNITNGYWKKGKYIGKYEKPFSIELITTNVKEVNVKNMFSGPKSEVTIIVRNATSGASNLNNQFLPKTRLIDIFPVNGSIGNKITDESSSTIMNKYTLQNVKFPFYAIYSFQTQGLQVEKAGVELFEPGEWVINVRVDN
jgi:hypothetical protein